MEANSITLESCLRCQVCIAASHFVCRVISVKKGKLAICAFRQQLAFLFNPGKCGRQKSCDHKCALINTEFMLQPLLQRQAASLQLAHSCLALSLTRSSSQPSALSSRMSLPLPLRRFPASSSILWLSLVSAAVSLAHSGVICLPSLPRFASASLCLSHSSRS
eukprot:6186601-Pleurochrysis_carterae.AAC.1